MANGSTSCNERVSCFRLGQLLASKSESLETEVVVKPGSDSNLMTGLNPLSEQSTPPVVPLLPGQ
jgi:hypothetical protein